MYTYSAFVTGVHDGDSITVDIDLGFGVWLKKQKIRLMGIDAPELRGTEEERKEAIAVRDYLRKRILNQKVTIETHKDSKGKYGRWLAVVIINEDNINRELSEKFLSVEEYVK